ncbi:MAG: tetratricopeptide repeat protein [Phycisphaerales bacterium]
MERKYNEQDLEQAIRRMAPGEPPRPDFAQWREKHPEALRKDKSRIGAATILRFGRNVMRKDKVRFGAIAAALFLALVFLGTGTDKAWSFEQTLAAMKRIETVHITGKNLCGGKMVDFECWVRAPAEGSDLLRLRYHCGCERNTTLAVQGNTVYRYMPGPNLVNILDASKIEDLQYWYEGAMISPWLTGKLLETLRLVGRGWEQTTVTDPNTGKEQIRVTCSHPKSNVSALLLVDPETKLVLKAKLWRNLQREGMPTFDAQTIVYNPEIPDEFFEFQIPPGATVIAEKDSEEVKALFERAEQLVQDKKWAEGLELYQQVYGKYPYVGWGSTSLMMIGICHSHLGDNAKAIEFLQRALREYPTGWEGVVQFYLGAAYMDNGQTQEALKAFDACLADAEGKRDPDQFPIKEARDYIAKIRGQ